MIAHVVEGQRRLLTQRLLKFQVPLLVTRVLDPACHRVKRGGSKTGYAALNAGKRSPIGERVPERRIALSRKLCLIVGHIGRQRTTCYVEPHLQWRVAPTPQRNVSKTRVGAKTGGGPH